jgi:uncharacterized protein (TIGR00369 family)
VSLPVRTHPNIDPHWVGTPTSLEEGSATATLLTRPEMAADPVGLVHGGFVFGLVDYAAMLAVNDPHVVLGAANVRFTAPVRVGETVSAQARVVSSSGRKREIEVRAVVGDKEVLTGTLTAFVLDKHVLGPV